MGEERETNFEINLLPVISLLAVIIGFLLVTAVWLPLGGFHVKQAIGESAEKQENQKESKFQVHLHSDEQISVEVESEGRTLKSVKLSESQKDYASLKQTLQSLREKFPEIQRVFLMPAPTVKYQNVVTVFSILNELELKEVGLQPTI